MAEETIPPMTDEEFKAISKWLNDRIFEHRAMTAAQRFLNLYAQGRRMLDALDEDVKSRKAEAKEAEQNIANFRAMAPAAKADANRAQKEAEAKKAEFAAEVTEATKVKEAAVADMQKAVTALNEFKAGAEKEAGEWAAKEVAARKSYEKFMASLASAK